MVSFSTSWPQIDTRPALGREIARDHLHGGGFAGAVGPEKAQHLALVDAEVDP